MDFVKAFLAGFVSTLVFRQGVLTLFYLAGAFPRAPYDLGPVPPLGIPAVISLAFCGAVQLPGLLAGLSRRDWLHLGGALGA